MLEQLVKLTYQVHHLLSVTRIILWSGILSHSYTTDIKTVLFFHSHSHPLITVNSYDVQVDNLMNN